MKIDLLEDWTQLFHRQNGWVGADCALSMQIPGNRTLWVYGDTFIGSVTPEGSYSEDLVMLNNSLCVHPTPKSGEAPNECDLQLLYKEAKEPATIKTFLENKEITKKHESWATPSIKGWYWLMGDGVLANDSLYLFAPIFDNIKDQSDITIPWNFQYVGEDILKIKNINEDATTWEYERIPLEHMKFQRISEPGEKFHYRSWGCSTLQEEGIAYIYGVERTEDGNKHLILAKVNQEKLEDFSAWEFYGETGWSKNSEDLRFLASSMVDEFSIDLMDIGNGQKAYVLVYSEIHLGKKVLARASREKTGPFSEPIHITDIVAYKPEINYAYAAKAHPEISRPGELTITYIYNSHDLDALLKDGHLYRPRFMSVQISELGEALRDALD